MDVLGLLLAIVVVAASTQDSDVGRVLLPAALKQTPTLQRIWVDGGGFRSHALHEPAKAYPVSLEVIQRPKETLGFQLLAHAWVVERTLGWWNWERRLAKDFE